VLLGNNDKMIDGLKILVASGKLFGYEIEGQRYDTGDKLGFIKATIDFALKRKDIGPEFLRYLLTIELD